tara:strand:- start:22 stop:1602 length:1581 start_codon:yes stop_codon:yes gene_type:complete
MEVDETCVKNHRQWVTSVKELGLLVGGEIGHELVVLAEMVKGTSTTTTTTSTTESNPRGEFPLGDERRGGSRWPAGPFANDDPVVSPMSRILDILTALSREEDGEEKVRSVAESGLSKLTPLYAATIGSGGGTICDDEGGSTRAFSRKRGPCEVDDDDDKDEGGGRGGVRHDDGLGSASVLTRGGVLPTPSPSPPTTHERTKRARTDEASASALVSTEGGDGGGGGGAAAAADETKSGEGLGLASAGGVNEGRSGEASAPVSALVSTEGETKSGGGGGAAAGDEMNIGDEAKEREDVLASLMGTLGDTTDVGGAGDTFFATEASASAFDEGRGEGTMKIGGCLTNVNATAGIPVGQYDAGWKRSGTALEFAKGTPMFFFVPDLGNAWSFVYWKEGGTQLTVWWCEPDGSLRKKRVKPRNYRPSQLITVEADQDNGRSIKAGDQCVVIDPSSLLELRTGRKRKRTQGGQLDDNEIELMIEKLSSKAASGQSLVDHITAQSVEYLTALRYTTRASQEQVLREQFVLGP